MIQTLHTFGKDEKLCSDKLIEQLFASGSSFVKYPLRVVYMNVSELPADTNCQVLTSVSKRRFKRAVKRNRVKRLIREAYRLNKHLLSGSINGKLILGFVFIGTDLPEYKSVEKSMIYTLTKLAELQQPVEISM
jgi:ribonuclease P protein component